MYGVLRTDHYGVRSTEYRAQVACHMVERKVEPDYH